MFSVQYNSKLLYNWLLFSFKTINTTSPKRCIIVLLNQDTGLFCFCSHPIIFLEPLGGAGALWAIICSRSLSLTLAHPCNIMWDEGNCYGKLNEIKREKQLHSPLSCVISELSLWWSCPDGLRVWWSWQPAAPGPDGNPISGPPLFHGSLSPCDSLYSSFPPDLLSFSVQGWWPFNYQPHSEQTNLGPQFQGVCAWESFFPCTCCTGVPSSVHIVRLSIDSLIHCVPTSRV